MNQDMLTIAFTDGSIRPWDDEQAKKIFWHSSAHLMAEALESLYPGVKFGVGPAVETGFYYDVDFGGQQISESDLKRIEDKIRKTKLKLEVWITHNADSEKRSKKIKEIKYILEKLEDEKKSITKGE